MQQSLDLKRMEKTPGVAILYQRYAPGILTYLRLHVSSREDAEDLLVDTFLAGCESQSFQALPEERQRLWLWRVARNKVADYYRSPSQRTMVNVDELADALYADEDQMPELLAERGEEYLRLRSQVQQLPWLQQQILRLRFVNNLNSMEIARLVGKSDAAVRMMLLRTLNLLRSAYSEK
ncbi:DNA-directed RNA polymerase sigma-70 factor [Dictyobacter alpinus]|uniref:DNA-directed RNA polymerase sigma-70 factor n=1 Tax=Dictyobacter alpinus TaxID=2014873 RepID=A0A402BDZ1_9CHLR|nr:sigma-70 family RNA polymerase sigma factor [Dictyobacter alpinus]GCE29618.1 DNA-directed RNA polymerase sigma-70 factor [Dictyobacter alpinus]